MNSHMFLWFSHFHLYTLKKYSIYIILNITLLYSSIYLDLKWWLNTNVLLLVCNLHKSWICYWSFGIISSLRRTLFDISLLLWLRGMWGGVHTNITIQLYQHIHLKTIEINLMNITYWIIKVATILSYDLQRPRYTCFREKLDFVW